MAKTEITAEILRNSYFHQEYTNIYVCHVDHKWNLAYYIRSHTLSISYEPSEKKPSEDTFYHTIKYAEDLQILLNLLGIDLQVKFDNNQNVWHNTNEKLPPSSKEVLVEYDRGKSHDVAFYCKDENYFLSGMCRIWPHEVNRWAYMEDILDRTNE